MIGLGISLMMVSAHIVGEGEPNSIKVMTFNIRYGTASDGENHWEKRKEGVFDLIRDQSADVVGLQEALTFQIDEILAAVPGYRYFGVGRDDGVEKGEYSAVLYKRRRLGLVEGGTKWISSQPDSVGSIGPGAQIPRVFTWCQFKGVSGERLMVVNTHFDHQSAEARLLGAQMISQFVAERWHGERVIVMGDLNCGRESEPVKALLAGGFVSPRPEGDEIGTFTGFRVGETGGEMIDHILGKRVVIRSVEIDRRRFGASYPSDHFPVIADVLIDR